MLSLSRHKDWRNKSVDEEKRRKGECNSREKHCSKRKRLLRRLLLEHLLKVTWLILYPLCFQHSTKMVSSMTQWKEVWHSGGGGKH